MRRIAAALTVMTALASPAYATQCPALWQQVNDKMRSVHLSAEDQARLDALRQQADTFHHAGKHSEAEAALNQALGLFEPLSQPFG